MKLETPSNGRMLIMIAHFNMADNLGSTIDFKDSDWYDVELFIWYVLTVHHELLYYMSLASLYWFELPCLTLGALMYSWSRVLVVQPHCLIEWVWGILTQYCWLISYSLWDLLSVSTWASKVNNMGIDLN